MRERGLVVYCAFWAAGCIAQPPAPLTQPPHVSAEVLERLSVQPTGLENADSIAILGSSTPAVEPSRADGRDSDGATLAPDRLRLDEVLTSVETHFPLILAALEEVEIAAGRAQAAAGEFDTKVISKNLFQVEDYYESERLDFGIEQPTTLFGASFSGGYRRGSGDFAVYDGKAKTNDGGEFRLGVTLPLLQGGRIDPQRVALWQARIAEQRAQPLILEKRLAATRKAASAYWTWVARGAKAGIARRLLALAEDRATQVQTAVDEGELAAINLTDNRRLIVERRATLTKAERGLQEAAIVLSLFWRDSQSRPVVPDKELLPSAFPSPRDPGEVLIVDDAAIALAQRPEVRALQLELASLGLDRDLARNQRLANLDVGVFAAQDVGGAVNDPDDKGPFELGASVNFELPLQRRKARGKERETRSKMSKLARELAYAKDVVVTEVQDVVSALRQSWLRTDQARENVELAEELERAERLRLQLGESDLFRVNLREQQTAVAASSLIDALAEYFKALADYRAAIGLPYDEMR